MMSLLMLTFRLVLRPKSVLDINKRNKAKPTETNFSRFRDIPPLRDSFTSLLVTLFARNFAGFKFHHFPDSVESSGGCCRFNAPARAPEKQNRTANCLFQSTTIAARSDWVTDDRGFSRPGSHSGSGFQKLRSEPCAFTLI